MNSLRKPSALFVFYTHTQQSLRVAEAMAGVLRERGCDVTLAGIEFTDPHYARKFGRFPFPARGLRPPHGSSSARWPQEPPERGRTLPYVSGQRSSAGPPSRRRWIRQAQPPARCPAGTR